MHRPFALAVACVALYAVSSWAQTKPADSWVGTWKTDLAKSKYSPGPAPKVPGTVTVERSGTGMKTTIDGTNAQGQPTHTETVWTFDGKDNPVKGAAPIRVMNLIPGNGRIDVMVAVDWDSALSWRIEFVICKSIIC